MYNRNVYDSLKRINEQKGNEVKYIGTIVYPETSSTGKISTIHDVFVMNYTDSNGNISEKYYNEDGICLAVRWLNGEILPTSDFEEQDLSFLAQLEMLSNNEQLSLNDLDRDIEKVAKELGISREDIKSMTTMDLEQKVGEKEKQDEKISLEKDDNQSSVEKSEKNKDTLEKMNSKQEVDTDKLIDDRHSLADVLGLPSGCKLIAVYSDAIINNENTTRFSFVIQNPDGSLSPADILEQTGGKDSDKTIYETNRDGSDVSKVNVKSSFKIDSPIVRNGILNIRYGSMGYIEANYGEMDPTDHNYAFTQKLETDHDYYTTKEVRDEFSSREDGEHNIEENIDELKKHPGKKTLEDGDGDFKTTHDHDEVLALIKSYDPNIEVVFTDKEIDDRLEKMMLDYPDEKFGDAIYRTQRDLSEDASHMRTRGEHQ